MNDPYEICDLPESNEIKDDCVNLFGNSNEQLLLIGNKDTALLQQASRDLMEKRVKYTEFNDDPQMKLFTNLLCHANFFASPQLGNQVQNIPKIAKTIENLIIDFKKEAKENKEILDHFHNIILCFNKVTNEIKTHSKKVIPILEKVLMEMNVLKEVFSKKEELNLYDENDAASAFQVLIRGSQKLAEFSRQKKKEIDDINRVAVELNKIVSQKINTSKDRVQYSEIIASLSGSLECAAVGGAIKAAGVAAEALVTRGAFNPMALAGSLGFLTIGAFLKYLAQSWGEKNKQALIKFSVIYEHLEKLQDESNKVLILMEECDTTSSRFNSWLDEIPDKLKKFSPRQRDICAELVKNACSASEDLIKNLKSVLDISFSFADDTPAIHASNNK